MNRSSARQRSAAQSQPYLPLDFLQTDANESNADEYAARALLGLFYYRRILDHQAIALLVRHVKPLSAFYDLDEAYLKALFASHFQLRAYVSASQLVNAASRDAASRYSDRMWEVLNSRFHGSLQTAEHPNFPHQLRKAPLEIGWLFRHTTRIAPAPQSPVVAIIGSRQSSRAQLSIAADAAKIVAQAGGTVLTGLATGADGAAHRAARETSANIVAVLGSGAGKVYPTEHTAWVNELIEGRGEVLAEVPPDHIANQESFIWRNRVVASLADVVVAVSGTYSSGTSHTLRFAADAGVQLLSLDGSVDSGVSRLITELGGDRVSLDGFAAFLGVQREY